MDFLFPLFCIQILGTSKRPDKPIPAYVHKYVIAYWFGIRWRSIMKKNLTSKGCRKLTVDSWVVTIIFVNLKRYAHKY